MAQSRNLSIKFESDASQIKKDIAQLKGDTEGFKTGLIGLTAAAGTVSAVTIGLGTAAIATGIKFEQLQTRLETTLGSKGAAAAAFKTIQLFAATTPFQLDEVTNAFLSLKNRGIDPTNETLRKLGDLASSQGKGLQQVVEAVLDASTFEFERLKELGVSASKSGDKVTLAFKGTSTTVAATNEAITAAVVSFGALKGVAGGMEKQSLTLGGQLSNLADSTDSVNRAFAKLTEGPVKATVAAAASLVNTFLALPAPLQNAIFATGILAGTIATLTVAVVGFELANGKAVAANTLLTLGMIKDTAVTNANAVAKIALAIATNTASESMKAAVISAAANTAAFAGAAIAIAAVVDSYVKVDAAASKIRASTQSVNDALTSLEEVRAKAIKNAAAAAAGTNLEAAAVKRTTEEVGGFQRVLDVVRDKIPGVATSVESSISRQKVAFGDLTVSANNVLNEFDKLKAKGLSIASKEELDAEKQSIDAAIASMEARIPIDAAEAVSKGQYLKSLKAAKAELDALTASTFDSKKALEALTKSYTEGSAKIEASALSKRATIAEFLAATGADEKTAAADLFAIDQQSATDRLKLAQDNLPKLSALKVSEKDPAKLEAINGQILKLEGDVSSGRIAIAKAGLAEQKRIEDERLNVLLKAGSAALTQLGLDADQQKTILLESLIAQGKDAEAGNAQLAAIDKAAIQTRIAQNTVLLKGLREQQLGASPEQLEKINAEIFRLEGDTAKGRQELARGTLAERKRAEVDYVKAVKDSTDEALKVVKQAEGDRLLSIQQSLNKGLITEEQANAQRLDSKRKLLNDELFATNAQVDKLEALPKLNDPVREAARLTEIQAARDKASTLTLNLLENEFQKQEQHKKDLIKGIEERRLKQKDASDSAVLGYDREKQAIDAILQASDRQNKLIQSRLGVTTALGNLEQVRSQNTIANLTRAGEIRKQLDDDTEESAATRLQLEAELNQLTGGTGAKALDIILRRQTAEDALITQQQKAREREQAAARITLDNEIARNKLLADRALIEARIAELRSRQQLVDATAGLQKARTGGNAREIADAQTLVGLAGEGVVLGGQNVRLSQQSVTDQVGLAANSRQQLGLEQQAVNEGFRGSNLLRENAQSEELVRAGGSAASNRFTGGLIPTRSPITPTNMQVSGQVDTQTSRAVKIGIGELAGEVRSVRADMKSIAAVIANQTPPNVNLQVKTPVIGDDGRRKVAAAKL